MNKLIKLLVIAMFAMSGLAQAENPPTPRLSELSPNDSILKDVYVRLYLTRLQLAKLTVERTKAELQVSYKIRDRREILYKKQAVTAEELELARRDVEIAAIAVQQAEINAAEAEIFVDLAISRVSLGLEMPICAQIQ